MSTRDIEGNMTALRTALDTGDGDMTDEQKLAVGAGLALLQGFLIDVNRIADALTVLAAPPVVKVDPTMTFGQEGR